MLIVVVGFNDLTLGDGATQLKAHLLAEFVLKHSESLDELKAGVERFSDFNLLLLPHLLDHLVKYIFRDIRRQLTMSLGLGRVTDQAIASLRVCYHLPVFVHLFILLRVLQVFKMPLIPTHSFRVRLLGIDNGLWFGTTLLDNFTIALLK